VIVLLAFLVGVVLGAVVGAALMFVVGGWGARHAPGRVCGLAGEEASVSENRRTSALGVSVKYAGIWLFVVVVVAVSR
jgi:hypothetical protein